MGEGFPPPAREERQPPVIQGEPTETQDTFDRKYWTPERISDTITNFFEQLEWNSERFREERKKLLEQAIAEEEARKKAEKAIAEKASEEAEKNRREEIQQEIQESEESRLFRGTLEWMIEQSTDLIRELAIRFLNQQGAQAPNVKK